MATTVNEECKDLSQVVIILLQKSFHPGAMYQCKKKAICEFDPPRYFRIVGNRGEEDDDCLCIVFLAFDKGSKARVDIILHFSLPYTGSWIQTPRKRVAKGAREA